MREVYRRIAIHGGLTALILGVMGLLFAEIATITLASSPGVRAETGEPIAAGDENSDLAARLRSRVPLLMAVWGFLFVAVGEVVMHVWRTRKPPPPAQPPPPDEAERLLEELLALAESKGETQKAEGSGQRAEEKDQTGAEPGTPPGATPPTAG